MLICGLCRSSSPLLNDLPMSRISQSRVTSSASHVRQVESINSPFWRRFALYYIINVRSAPPTLSRLGRLNVECTQPHLSALKPAIDALVAEPAFGSCIHVYAYVDDVHIVGDVDDVLAAHTAFIQHLRRIELVVNTAKCSFIYFHRTRHPLTPAQSVSASSTSGVLWFCRAARRCPRRRCCGHCRAAAQQAGRR